MKDLVFYCYSEKSINYILKLALCIADSYKTNISIVLQNPNSIVLDYSSKLKVYDLKNGEIQTEVLQEGWQTSGSKRAIRLAFNLYTNGIASVDDYEDEEEKLDECRSYAVEEIFCCGYAPYFWQAVRLRYPEFCG